MGYDRKEDDTGDEYDRISEYIEDDYTLRRNVSYEYVKNIDWENIFGGIINLKNANFIFTLDYFSDSEGDLENFHYYLSDNGWEELKNEVFPGYIKNFFEDR